MTSWPDPNNLTQSEKNDLKEIKWLPNDNIDLHKLGVHYYTPEYLPTDMDPLSYITLYRRGLTPPTALPVKFKEGVHNDLNKFLDENYHNLHMGGVSYLGNEFNVQRAEEWDEKPLKVCFCRISPYTIVDGGFGHYLINNFVQDYSDKVFADFAYIAEFSDVGEFITNGFPILFGRTTKRPISDFDIIILATIYPEERIHLPFAMARSGIPLHKWERFDKNLPYRDKCPITVAAGIGASFIENYLDDNPIHGIGQNSLFDHVVINEGELVDLKYFLQYFNTVIEDGGTKEDFLNEINNERHSGCYDPTKILFEYADKKTVEKDFNGKVLSEKTFIGGGNIKSISLVDDDNETLHVLKGEGSEEFEDLVPIQDQFIKNFGSDSLDSGIKEEIGLRYAKGTKGVKISDQPSMEDRKKIFEENEKSEEENKA